MTIDTTAATIVTIAATIAGKSGKSGKIAAMIAAMNRGMTAATTAGRTRHPDSFHLHPRLGLLRRPPPAPWLR